MVLPRIVHLPRDPQAGSEWSVPRRAVLEDALRRQALLFRYYAVWGGVLRFACP